MMLGLISLGAVFSPNSQLQRSASRTRRLAAGLCVVVLSAGALSCSDAVEPDSLGNFSLTIAGKPLNAPAKSECKASQLVAGAGTPRPSEYQPGGRVTLDKACTVKKAGDVFEVQGRVTLGSATSFYVRSTNVDPTTRMGTAIVTVDSGGQSYGTCFAGDCVGVTAPEDCTLEVIQTNGADGPETQVKGGAIWAKLDCPLLRGGQLNDYCRGTGVFVLENCDK